MLLLAIDTSGKSGGITLANGELGSFCLLESAPIAGGTFSAQLVPTVAVLLRKHGLVAKDVDGFVAVSGPGSFTGLRVGLSAIKGLVEVLQKPIATVSLLELLAAISNVQGRVVSALDAGRGEIFFGVYDVFADTASKREERLLSRSEFLAEVKRQRPIQVVTSDPAVAQLGDSGEAPIAQVERPGSDLAARLGLHKLLRGETVSVETLDANYIRRSDAEIFSGRPDNSKTT
jgi:tRNA threonylcarbamoyladenosine biosynthesis protein TsaB